MVAPLLPGARKGVGGKAFVSNERDHVYSGRTSSANQPARQGKARQGGISASGETKFILNQPRQPRSRTMPANSTTSTAAAARASVQIRRSLPQSSGSQHRLNGHRQTEVELARPGGGAGGKGDKQRSKAKWETGASREEVREGWSSRRW